MDLAQSTSRSNVRTIAVTLDAAKNVPSSQMNRTNGVAYDMVIVRDADDDYVKAQANMPDLHVHSEKRRYVGKPTT